MDQGVELLCGRLVGGLWRGRRILPEAYLDEMLAPCPIKPDYGFLWWLNTGGTQYPSAPVTSVYAVGAGGNLIWVDRDLGLTVVARWLDDAAADGFMARVLAALS